MASSSLAVALVFVLDRLVALFESFGRSCVLKFLFVHFNAEQMLEIVPENVLSRMGCFVSL